jgi:hypothetical protein
MRSIQKPGQVAQTSLVVGCESVKIGRQLLCLGVDRLQRFSKRPVPVSIAGGG